MSYTTLVLKTVVRGDGKTRLVSFSEKATLLLKLMRKSEFSQKDLETLEALGYHIWIDAQEDIKGPLEL